MSHKGFEGIIQELKAEEVLERLRAEYDYLWHTHNRDFRPDGPAFSLSAYCAGLETLIMNRMFEAGLPRGRFGTGGVVEWERARAECVDGRRRLQDSVEAVQRLTDGIGQIAQESLEAAYPPPSEAERAILKSYATKDYLTPEKTDEDKTDEDQTDAETQDAQTADAGQ